MDFPRIWYYIKWQDKKIPPRALAVIEKNVSNARSISCRALKESSMWTSHFNHLLHRMVNLVHVNLAYCMILYEVDWLVNCPNVTSLVVSSCPNMSSSSFVTGMSSLKKLEYLEVMNNRRLVAIQIVEVAKELPALTQLNCYATGNMRAWMAEEILDACPNLQGFQLSSNFIFDDSWDCMAWYHITKRKHSDVVFSKNIQRKVQEYMDTDPQVNMQAWQDFKKDRQQ